MDESDFRQNGLIDRLTLPIFVVVLAAAFGGLWWIRFPKSINAVGNLEPASTNMFPGKYEVRLVVPKADLDKIHIGEKVQVRFPAYPFQALGPVEGRLYYISGERSGKGVSVLVCLPTFKKDSLGPDTSGAEARIIIGEERLLYKIAQPFERVFSSK